MDAVYGENVRTADGTAADCLGYSLQWALDLFLTPLTLNAIVSGAMGVNGVENNWEDGRIICRQSAATYFLVITAT